MAINPDVVILDEVTSNLSYESELLVKHAIEEITKGKIVFIIAHRLTTIKNCNHIVVIKDGKIQEEGNHSELLKQQGAYYQLIQSRAEKNPFLCSKAGN